MGNILKKYNNAYHRTIEMKPVDVKSKIYTNFKRENNYKDPTFTVGEYVRISKYKNIFAKGYVPKWSEEVFVIKQLKNTVPWAYLIEDPNGGKIIGTFYKKRITNTKVNKRKSNKLYVKWKGHDNSFNSWLDKLLSS